MYGRSLKDGWWTGGAGGGCDIVGCEGVSVTVSVRCVRSITNNMCAYVDIECKCVYKV